MVHRSSSMALIVCCTALFAATCFLAPPKVDRPLFESNDNRFFFPLPTKTDRPSPSLLLYQPRLVFDQFPTASLMDSIVESLKDKNVAFATDEFKRLPAVATAAEISDADKAEILNLVIADVLQSADFQESRDFYGTPGSRTAVIVTDSDVKFPKQFKVTVAGWKIACRTSTEVLKPDSPRVVAIRFDKFAPHEPAQFLFDGHVSLRISNGGGNPDGKMHIGGCLAYYCVHRSSDGWSVRCVFSKDS